jgi:hypothetical protein
MAAFLLCLFRLSSSSLLYLGFVRFPLISSKPYKMSDSVAKRADRTFSIGGRKVGPGHPCYIIAELSGNHLGDINKALEMVRSAQDFSVRSGTVVI